MSSPEKNILLLSDVNSPHTRKWASALAVRNFKVLIFTLSKKTSNWTDEFPMIKVVDQCAFDNTVFHGGLAVKIQYLKVVPVLKNIIKDFKPDIVHAHYASSYGLIGALSGFHPFIISVWGSDVYEFPSNFIKKNILKYNFRIADLVLSTSEEMKIKTSEFTAKEIEVTPFGIDTTIFKPMSVDSLFNVNDIVIGTIKSLEKIYGINYLLLAFKELKNRFAQLPLKLLIVGGGILENEYREYAKELGINEFVIFTGKVSPDRVVEYFNMLDIFVALSNAESFGVAVIEAQACELPVVVSNVGGLPEVVNNNSTGFVIPSGDPIAAADAISKLILNEDLRFSFGKNGRANVQKKYEWSDNLETMISIYKRF